MNLQTLFWKIFTPYEVRLTIKFIEDFFNREDTKLNFFCVSAYNPNQIRADVIKSASKKTEQIVYSIRIMHAHPESIALTLIAEILFWEIGCGSHHRYRGLLNDGGFEMMRLLEIAFKISLEKEYVTQEEVAKLRLQLMQDIKTAG